MGDCETAALAVVESKVEIPFWLERGINSKTNDVSTQQWAAISYYCGNNSESTADQVVGKALGGCFSGAAAGIVMAGIATGGVGLIAGLA